jgi:GNAT superfamily N-acetyltransferase
MLFADSSLTHRIEGAERRLTTDVAAGIAAQDVRRSVFVADVCGGTAVHVGSASPFNKMIGLGLEGPLGAAGEAALERIEREFDARRTPLQAEVSTLADSSVVRALSKRGYSLVGFENVLGLRLDEHLAATASPEVLVTTLSDHGDDEGWLAAVLDGFAHPDSAPAGESHESFPREALEQATTDMGRATGFTRHVARVDGVVAGGASLRIFAGVAQLCGAATLPAHRRRGVQTALFVHRLREAQRAGCDVAVVTTQPGSKSQENAQRRGFSLLYARAILVREPT